MAGAVGAAVAGAIAIVVVLSSGGPVQVHSAAVTASTPASATSGAASQRNPGLSAPVHPQPGERRVIQSAQLALTTAPNRIDDVAREVFDVVSRQNAVVSNSTVTATGGPDGSAQFQLSVPSSALSAEISALSRLRYAVVASRTDATQDVTGRVAGTGHRLADARALRTSLLAQLSNATTQQQIDSLRTQIHDAEASIAGDEAALRWVEPPGRFQPPRRHDQRGCGSCLRWRLVHDR